jgi:hypothetical protein
VAGSSNCSSRRADCGEAKRISRTQRLSMQNSCSVWSRWKLKYVPANGYLNVVVARAANLDFQLVALDYKYRA